MARSPQRPAETGLSGTTPGAAALVVLLTPVALGLFLREFPDMVGPAAIGSVGSVLLALALWLSRGRNRPVTGLAAGLALGLAGVAVAGGVLAGVLLLVEDIFPVEEEALLSVGWLVILGNVGVVVGCLVAVLGLVVSHRNVAAGDGIEQAMRVAVASGAVPIGTAFVFLMIAVATGTTADAAVVGPVGDRLGLLLTPVQTFLPDPFVIPVCLAALLGLSVLALGRLQQSLASARLLPGPHTAGSLVGGAVGTVAVIAAAEWAYTRATEELLERFPVEIEDQLRDATTTTATSLGESTVALLAVVLCLGVIASLLGVVYLTTATGLLSRESVGASLAAIGIFLAAVLGGTVGAPTWLVVVGVAASLLVWDAGRFGVTLAREVGAGRTRRIELLHLGGALVVGTVAAVGALVLVGPLPTDPNAGAVPDGTELLALCSVVVGLLSLVLSLR